MRRGLIGYAVATIALYAVWGFMSGDWNIPLGPIDKLIELALVALLWQADRQQASHERHSPHS